MKRWLGRGRLYALVIAVGVRGATAVGGAVSLAAGDSSNTIQACAQKKNGQLRVVASASECRPSERAIAWTRDAAAPARDAGVTAFRGRVSGVPVQPCDSEECIGRTGGQGVVSVPGVFDVLVADCYRTHVGDFTDLALRNTSGAPLAVNWGGARPVRAAPGADLRLVYVTSLEGTATGAGTLRVFQIWPEGPGDARVITMSAAGEISSPGQPDARCAWGAQVLVS